MQSIVWIIYVVFVCALLSGIHYSLNEKRLMDCIEFGETELHGKTINCSIKKGVNDE